MDLETRNQLFVEIILKMTYTTTVPPLWWRPSLDVKILEILEKKTFSVYYRPYKEETSIVYKKAPMSECGVNKYVMEIGDEGPDGLKRINR